MAEGLRAADIELQLKAMLQLTGGPAAGGVNGGQAGGGEMPTEQSASYKKQRKPRKKKKKSSDTQEGVLTQSPSAVPQTDVEGNHSPRKPVKNSAQTQQRSTRQKQAEQAQVTGSDESASDRSRIDSCPVNQTISSTTPEDQNTNQNSTGYEKSKRSGQNNRPGLTTTPQRKDQPGGWKSNDGKTSPDILEELAGSGIYPLKKKSTRFPWANFFCRVCEFHCDRVPDCRDHMKDRRHLRRLEISKGDKQLRDIPTPSLSHIAALTSTITQVAEKYGLSEVEMKQRLAVVATLQEDLQALIPNLALELYGSSVTGFALKTSDANIDIILPKGQSASQALIIIYKGLKEMDTYSNVTSDFKAKIPSVSFEDLKTQTWYQLTVGNSQARETTELLALYNKIDPRVRQLAVAFRFWAKVCKVDQQMLGTMPAYVTTLLTVFYLQQLKPPVLPVLHEYANPPKTDGPVTEQIKPSGDENSYCHNLEYMRQFWQTENKQSVGELWLNMIKFYSLHFSITNDVVCIRQSSPMNKGEKKWSGKKLAVEDPFSRKRNVTRSVSSNLVFDYIYDCLRQAYRYFGTPQNSSHHGDRVNNLKSGKQPENMKGECEKSQKISATLNSDMETKEPCDSILCEKQENIPSPTLENQKNEFLVDNSVLATSISNSVIESTKDTVHQNANDIPCVNSEENEVQHATVSECAEKRQNSSLESSEESVSVSKDEKVERLELPDLDKPAEAGLPELVAIERFAEHIVQSVIRRAIYRVIGSGGMAPSMDSTLSQVNPAVQESLEETSSGPEEGTGAVSPSGLSETGSDNSQTEVQTETIHFMFSAETLTDGKGPAVVCSICQLEGHLKQACPEEKLPDLPPLPQITPTHVKIMSEFLKEVPGDFAPTRLEVEERNFIVSDLERYIQGEYPAARLSLFGSSCNGFGFRHSDLDICMTVDQPTAEGLDCVEIIETLAKMLKDHRGFYNVLPITTAKVPIVKFKHRHSNLEGDISLYNTLAQHNTDMLLMYSMIDQRVEILGYAMKVFAKICEIGDASRGSLSSYSYILMVLHYLQQCKPPVIPVLQELHPPDETPEVLVDGWNAWFFKGLKRLPQVWPDYGKNQCSVAELWMGMFRYYTEKFDFKEQVVCIRQLNTLTRFEKLWNGRCIAIEDPFDLSHNLGAGLSRKMNMYIQKAFIKGRLLYCTPISRLPPGYCTFGDYFFAPDKFTEEAPPTDKCCRACGKIGHFVKECPIVRNRKHREEEEKRKRREYERSPGEERGHHGRRDNRGLQKDNGGNPRGRRDENMWVHSQEFTRRPGHDQPNRGDPRGMWSMAQGGVHLDPYMNQGLLPHHIGQGQFPGSVGSGSPRAPARAPTSPRQAHSQREPVSPNTSWQPPMMRGAPLYYYNQPIGSNHSSSADQRYAGSQQRAHSSGAAYKQYSNSGAQYQQQFSNQGRHQEGFHSRQYTPRDSERYDSRYNRKL